MTKDELQEWKANPVTEFFHQMVEMAIEAVKDEPRIYGSIDETALYNAKHEGRIETYEEILNWYNLAMEELNED